MTRSTLLKTALAATLALPLLAGCGGVIDAVQADNVAIAALVKTPELENPQTKEKVPGVTTFTLFFGSIDKSKIGVGTGTGGADKAEAGAFTGLKGATVKIGFKDPARGDTEINVPDKGDGKYAIDSATANLLTYSETEYTTTISYGGKTYKLKVTAPVRTDIKEFSGQAADQGIVRDWEPGAAFTVTRLLGAGPAKNPIAFVTLNPVTGDQKADGYNNAPKDAFGFLQLALDDSAWRADAFTIPGDQFLAHGTYLVTLTATERGGVDVSTGTSALFVGSSFLAGVAAGGGVLTR